MQCYSLHELIFVVYFCWLLQPSAGICEVKTAAIDAEFTFDPKTVCRYVNGTVDFIWLRFCMFEYILVTELCESVFNAY